MCSKGIWVEAVFTKTEINNVQNVNSLQNSPLAAQYTYSREIPVGWSTGKSFGVFHVLKSYEWSVSEKKKTMLVWRVWRGLYLHHLFFLSRNFLLKSIEIHDQKVSRIDSCLDI